jgi:NTP pyrophosphatase (non-canonical NTP hydrolase)
VEQEINIDRFAKALERIKALSFEQLKDPNENSYTILAHTMEELGEFSTALCIEDNSAVKGYKQLEESASQEAIDVMICAMSLYYSRGGKTEDVVSYLNKKLDKWERKIS